MLRLLSPMSRLTGTCSRTCGADGSRFVNRVCGWIYASSESIAARPMVGLMTDDEHAMAESRAETRELLIAGPKW